MIVYAVQECLTLVFSLDPWALEQWHPDSPDWLPTHHDFSNSGRRARHPFCLMDRKKYLNFAVYVSNIQIQHAALR